MTSPFTPASTDAVELRRLAQAASERAYVPYSRFAVGAALRFADGTTLTGCNVENASYGATICAERTVLVRAIAEGLDPSQVDLVAVHVDGPEGQPCGICRQVLVELVPGARVAFVSGGEYVEGGVADLLPAAFVPGALDA
ncbi:MAG: cytidine deaminase [Thermoleophilia bacterium]|nr:cytidine deaminase [Thermoleophilia bacterium]